MTSNPDQRDRARTFRQLHATRPLVLPNAWDPGSAKLIEAAGAHAIATTSAGVSWAHAHADGESLPVEQAVGAVAAIAQAVDVPVSADIEAAYGLSAADVSATVEAILRAGAVGINLEDADHADGHALIPTERQAERIAAAQQVGAAAGIDLWINARTDTYLLPDPTSTDRLAETLDRAAMYADAGADSLFVPGVTDPDIVSRLVGGPLPLNVMAGPGAPPINALARLGVARISVGSAIAQAALAQVERAAQELLGPGSYQELAQSLDYAGLNELYATHAQRAADDTTDLTQTTRSAMPFAATIGMQTISTTPDEVQTRLHWAPELCTSGGVLHGGALISLADAAGGILAFNNLPDDATGTTTVTSTTNLLRAVRDGTVTATSRLLHRGRTTLVVDTELRDDTGRLVARVTQVQAVLRPK